uniref:Uncharacterized protein n=1 Tax=Anguilla anguilla TaxID=7936 RepID=A0A0E9VMR1_ANGAN
MKTPGTGKRSKQLRRHYVLENEISRLHCYSHLHINGLSG